MLLMKLMDPFNVAKNDISLSTQRLRDVIAKQLLHIILDDIVQWSYVIAFRRNHLTNDQKKRPVETWDEWIKAL